MSAWVLLLDVKDSIHEGCEWARRIARRRDWSAFFGTSFFGVLWSAFFGTPFFGAPTFMSAWVLLLDAKDSIHEGHEGILDAPFLECYGAPSLERRFLERRHLCRHGFLLLDAKDSIHEGHEGRLDAPFLECYGAPSLERRFLERRHLCRHGFCYSM